MGGNAFAKPGPHGEPALDVPRLPPALYDELKKTYTAKLQELYRTVVTPHETPEKADHGDVDTLVESPTSSSGHSPGTLAIHFGATRHFTSGATTSLAIPLPDNPTQHFQLDIHVCPTEWLSWVFFQHSYGDLTQILGAIHRGHGLTATDRGLHLRIAAIEPHNRKASMVRLTRDPRAYLAFLGLDPDRWAAGFATLDEVYAWCARCRLLSAEGMAPRRREETANDRTRMRKRPMFARFVDEWLPAHAESTAGRAEISREAVREEALERFGVRREYEERLGRHRKCERDREVWARIAGAIPKENEGLGRALRGLKRWVAVDGVGGALSIRAEPDMVITEERVLWTQSVPKDGEEALLQWVRENWRAVYELERHRETTAKTARKAAKESV